VIAVQRLRTQDGMTLIELLIAMVVMAIGVSGLVAGFSSGLLSIQRGAKTSVAGTLADQKLETYRQATYASIPVGVQSPAPTTGSDNHTYYLATTVSWTCPVGPANTTTSVTAPACTGSAASRPVKLVEVVVHDSTATGKVVATQTSTFDASTS
jgi:prepilin-type N-terminal cleavage/methylation domain-containing protein